MEVVMTKERMSAALVSGTCRVDKGSAAHDVRHCEVNFQMTELATANFKEENKSGRADNVPYTTYFENARKDKGSGVMINPNDPEQNPEAFMAYGGGSDDVSNDNIVNDEKNMKHGDKKSMTSIDFNRKGSNSDFSNVQQNYKSDRRKSSKSRERISNFSPPSPSHGPNTPRYGYNRADDIPVREFFFEIPSHRSASVPMFGAWDEKDPKSGEGFTVIFQKVKEEKHIAATKFPPIPQQPSYNSNIPKNDTRSTTLAVSVQSFPINPSPSLALHHSQPWMGFVGLSDFQVGRVIGAGVTSLEKELKETKQTLGNAVLKLVKKASGEDNSGIFVEDPHSWSLVRESMKESRSQTDFDTPKKLSGEAQEEGNQSYNLGGQLKFVPKVASQCVSKAKTIRQEEAFGIRRGYKIDKLKWMKVVAKQIHLDKMVAKDCWKEQELSESKQQKLKRMAEVQEATQFNTEERLGHH
ncbi:RPM1-interacting protein 4-like protein [Tanacetum coccineum]|uniref:RPM1-interacting protein 4-like protein n=1 Tax=Tanacetum coccineum TaxID=301880 RepID=A0ABQ5HMM6_9ASTR